MGYVRGTLAAFAAALVPETPALSDRGEEHVPGALEAGVDDQLVATLEEFAAATDGPWALLGFDRVPLATAVALLFDLAALELLVRRRAADGLRPPGGAFAAGPFSRLSARDRLRAVRLLETDGLLANVGPVVYLVQVVCSTATFAYYGDAGGTGQGWDQAGYPGPADGYAVCLGYEVEAFEENDY